MKKVTLLYRNWSTVGERQYQDIQKFFDIVDKYFPNAGDTSAYGWGWRKNGMDFMYGIIFNAGIVPDACLTETKAKFPDLVLDYAFQIPTTFESVYECTLDTMQETYNKIWSKGMLADELEEYDDGGYMRISVNYA